MSSAERLRSLDATLSRPRGVRRRWTDAYPEDAPLSEEYISRLDTIDPEVALRTIAVLEDTLARASATQAVKVRRRVARAD